VIRGRYPAVADYDDDGISDLAAVSVGKKTLEWSVALSSTGQTMSTQLGGPDDTIVAGCRLESGKGASLVALGSRRPAVQFKNYSDTQARTVTLKNLGARDFIGCADSNGDGVDELLFATRKHQKGTNVVAYDTTGTGRALSSYNPFLRGFVVNRPNSQVPLVAVLGSVKGRGRQIRITTMAGSFAFPLFYIDQNSTVSSGTFSKATNEQVPGIFWVNNDSRLVYRRLLAPGATTTELFTLPKHYSLVRNQTIHRTGKR
jgi:hypothetical protein